MRDCNAKLNRIANVEGQYLFHCPGCKCCHAIWTVTLNPITKGRWEFNGDIYRPTVSPSILVRGTEPITDAQADAILRGEPFEPKQIVCHSFIREGKIQFLSDCTHELAGQTVDLPDWNDS